MPRGLELGIIGMKIGEVREIIAPSSFNTGTTPLSKKLFLSGKNTLFTVTLHDLKEDEKLDEIRDNLKFYDVLGSVSRRIACLDIVNLDIKVLNGAGEVIYRKPRNKNLRLAIGSGTMPYLEQVLIDSKNYGKRIAFAKTKFLEDLKKSPQLPGLTKVLEENDSVTLELSPSLL
jgi:FKBP-type peptidyl-prolyl cis-trans isomerase (trigger factor)